MGRVKGFLSDVVRQSDLVLLALCTVSTLYGMVLIASATYFRNTLRYVAVQGFGLFLGILLYFFLSAVDVAEIGKKWKWLLAFNFGFILLLRTPLGLRENIPVMDVNAACSGFLYGLAAAKGLLEQTGGKYALVVGCEQLSRLLDMTDRTTCILFGDGAGAAVVSLGGDGPFALTLGARGGDAIRVEGPGVQPTAIRMDGPAVFRFAVEAMPRCIREVLEKSGESMDMVDWFVCHQANERIIDLSIKKLGADPAKFYKNLSHTGNTSAASVPLALNELWESGAMKPGQTLVCVGFGAGLTWAGMLLQYRPLAAQTEGNA